MSLLKLRRGPKRFVKKEPRRLELQKTTTALSFNDRATVAVASL